MISAFVVNQQSKKSRASWKNLVQRFILNRKKNILGQTGCVFTAADHVWEFSLFTLSNRDYHMWTASCCCRVRIIPLKASPSIPSVFVLAANPPRSDEAPPVCCWFYSLKRMEQVFLSRRTSLPSRSIRFRNFVSRGSDEDESMRDERKVFQSCYNFFARVHFLLQKLKMHKTGIEWEKVEDPFNRSRRGEILLIWHFLLLSPRNAFGLQFSWSATGRDPGGESCWRGPPQCGPLSFQTTVHKTSHLSSSWH